MVNKEGAQKKVAELQMMEQRLQNYIIQKQNFQGQLLEIENALNETNSSEETYKIVGQVMIKTDKSKIVKELTEKKDLADKKIKEIEKQETSLREGINPLQKEVMESFKDGK